MTTPDDARTLFKIPPFLSQLASRWPVAGVFMLLAVAVWTAGCKNDAQVFEEKMQAFVAIEASVLKQWEQAQKTEDKQAAAKIYQAAAAEWARATAIAQELKGYNLSENKRKFASLLADYCEKRGALLQLLQQEATNNSIQVQSAKDSINLELEKLNAQIEALTK